jgi:DNA-directed RNA polymerase specialized sigma24 family protein
LDSKILDLLRIADWGSIALKLTDYAAKKARRYRWKMTTVVGGMNAEDLAYEAIAKVLDGERNWDPEKTPDLLGYLKSVVDSLISHLFQSMDRRKVQGFPKGEEEEILEESLKMADPESDEAKHLPGKSPTPEQALLSKEQQQAEETAYTTILNSVEGHEDLEAVTLCIMDGMTKPSEISEATGLEINQVYQLKRKLNRKASQIFKTMKPTKN